MSQPFKRSSSKWRRLCFRYHPEFGWWHIPNLTARLALGGTFHLFRTNSEGMRSDREYPRKAPAGRKRIIALGDSYTAGDGVNNGQRATDFLEGRNPVLDVMNFGLNGSGTDQQLLIYERFAKSFDADAILWFICVENIGRNTYQCFPSYNFDEHLLIYRPKPYFELEAGKLELHHVPVPRERRSLGALGDWAYGFPYMREHPEDPYAIYRYEQSDPWQLMRSLIERVLEQARPKPVFLVPLPMDIHYLEQCPPSYWTPFLSLNRPDERVYVLDVLSAFTYAPMEVRQHFRFDGDPHYTALAHSLLSDCVEYEMRRKEPELFTLSAPCE